MPETTALLEVDLVVLQVQSVCSCVQNEEDIRHALGNNNDVFLTSKISPYEVPNAIASEMTLFLFLSLGICA